VPGNLVSERERVDLEGGQLVLRLLLADGVGVVVELAGVEREAELLRREVAHAAHAAPQVQQLLATQQLEAVVEHLLGELVVDGVLFVVGHAVFAHENQIVAVFHYVGVLVAFDLGLHCAWQTTGKKG